VAERDGVRRGPDVLVLIAGLLTLGASAFVLTDGASWFPAVDGRWFVAGVAVLVGVALLASGRGRGRGGC